MLVSDEVTESLMIRGLSSVLNENGEVMGIITKHYPEIIKDNISKLSVVHQATFLNKILKTEPSVLKTDKELQSFISKVIEDFLMHQSIDEKAQQSAFYVLANRCKDLYDSVDWFDILCTLSKVISESTNAIAEDAFTMVLDWLYTSDKEYLLKVLHRTESKSYSAALKKKLYTTLIKDGLLDVKIARRIRSDSSGDLSKIVLSKLFQYRNKYDDEKFKTLIVQFCDTKHRWVARYIAFNMPKNLLAFLLSLKDPEAKNIIENRLEY